RPQPGLLGMSRVASPNSLGRHFQPLTTDRRDFSPESDHERELLAGIEEQNLQLGLYLFGAAILDGAVEDMNYRALKGPAGITKGTPRPYWYPAFPPTIAPRIKPPADDRLPDWIEIYPLAQKAMRSFADGGRGFESRVGSWEIAARPVIANDAR